MDKKPIMSKYPPSLKLLSFALIMAISALFTLLIGVLIAVAIYGPDVLKHFGVLSKLSDPYYLFLSKYMQMISQIGLFVFPPLIFAMMVNRNISSYLLLNKKPLFFSVIASVLVLFAATPFINFIILLNQSMVLPEFLSGIESWMRSSEDLANNVTQAYLNVNSVSGLLFNIFLIALIPAIGEEFVFRGVLVRLFKEWSKNYHVAIFISSMIFSTIHFQFYGFLPRFLLAELFGYLFVWTGSLWVPVLSHFINNLTSVIAAYCNGKGKAPEAMETFGTANNEWIWVVVSMIIVSGLLYMIYTKEKRAEEKPINP